MSAASETKETNAKTVKFPHGHDGTGNEECPCSGGCNKTLLGSKWFKAFFECKEPYGDLYRMASEARFKDTDINLAIGQTVLYMTDPEIWQPVVYMLMFHNRVGTLTYLTGVKDLTRTLATMPNIIEIFDTLLIVGRISLDVLKIAFHRFAVKLDSCTAAVQCKNKNLEGLKYTVANGRDGKSAIVMSYNHVDYAVGLGWLEGVKWMVNECKASVKCDGPQIYTLYLPTSSAADVIKCLRWLYENGHMNTSREEIRARIPQDAIRELFIHDCLPEGYLDKMDKKMKEDGERRLRLIGEFGRVFGEDHPLALVFHLADKKENAPKTVASAPPPLQLPPAQAAAGIPAMSPVPPLTMPAEPAPPTVTPVLPTHNSATGQ